MADDFLQTTWVEKKRPQPQPQNNHCLTKLRNRCRIDLRCIARDDLDTADKSHGSDSFCESNAKINRFFLSRAVQVHQAHAARSSPPPLTSLYITDTNNLSFYKAGLMSPFLCASLSEAAADISFDTCWRRVWYQTLRWHDRAHCWMFFCHTVDVSSGWKVSSIHSDGPWLEYSNSWLHNSWQMNPY